MWLHQNTGSSFARLHSEVDPAIVGGVLQHFYQSDTRKFLVSRARSLVIPGNSRYYCEALIESFAASHAGTLQEGPGHTKARAALSSSALLPRSTLFPLH